MFRLRTATAALTLALATAPASADDFPEYADDPSAFVTVIRAREYDEQFETVEDVLEHVAGVNVRRFGGLGAHSTASIRGSKGEQVLVLLDGMRLNSAQRSSVDLSTLTLRSVERIEVVRGGGSARHGSDAMGGVISITSRSADQGDVADASLTTGRFKTLGGDLFVAREIDAWRTSLGYSRLRSDNDFRFDWRKPTGGVWNFIPNSRHTRLNADFVEDASWLQVARPVGPTSEVSFSANGFRKDNGQPGSTLGRMFVPVTDEQLNCTNTDERYRRWLAGASFRERSFGEGSLEASFSHRYERSELDDPDRCLFELSPERTRFQSTENQSEWDLRYAGRRSGWGPLTLLGRASATTRVENVRPADADAQRRWVWRAFVQQDVGLFAGRLRVVPALGFEGANTSDGLARASASQRYREVDVDDDGEWLPRIGLIYRVANGLRLKANYLRAYRRPNFTELFHPDYGFVRGNPELAAEDSWNFDVGFELVHEGRGPLSNLRLEAAWFHRDIDDSIEWISFGSFVQPRNTGEARARGLETSGSLTLYDRLRLSASYTHLETEVERTGEDLPHAPRNQVFARAELPLGALRFWGEYRYEDESDLNPSVVRGLAGSFAVTAPEAHQFDAGVSLRPARVRGFGWVPEGVTVSSEWINLTNEQRIDALGMPLPDQTLWYLTVRAEFR